MLSRSEVYTTVREHFSREGAIYGIDLEDGSCVYRGDSQADSPVRCAFGIFIPDLLYNSTMENLNASDVVIRFLPEMFANDVLGVVNMPDAVAEMIHLRLENPVDRKWISQVQVIHDNCARKRKPMSTFIEALDLFAASTGVAPYGAIRSEQ